MSTISVTASLGSHQPRIDAALAEMAANRLPARIWAGDHTVWKPEPAEISNRLGWLHTAETMQENLPRLRALADDVRAAGYTQALLLGMGGSSLAPEVFRKTFGVADGYLDLAVLDSTVPGAVSTHAKRLDLARTVFLVSSKSGGTAETLSFFKFFYNRTVDAVGADRAGEHFVAITDPGTELVELAERLHFRATFLNDPNIGGRYSALSYFGLAPAALLGVDLPRLLDAALAAASSCGPSVPAAENPALWLGAVLGELAKVRRDKATFALSPPIASFGDWVEQLIAESLGKEGRGILPVVGEPLGPPDVYGDDRLFIGLGLGEETSDDAASAALEAAGHPRVRLHLRDRCDLGAQFFLWEMAVAVAGHRLGVNPFDQPNVESAKQRAREMIADYRKTGSLPEETPTIAGDGISVFGDVSAILAGVRPGAYIAVQAYLEPTAETDAALARLRLQLRDRTRLATTVGYGPRFLHSTGQLHKGDAGRGLFFQLTADPSPDLPIPEEPASRASSITFGVLTAAEARGDRQALVDAGRRVLRLHLAGDVVSALGRLSHYLYQVPIG